MIKCTSPNGKPVYVNPKTVAAIEHREDGSACVFLTGGGTVIVNTTDADKLAKDK